jgi:hypothetical protein
MNHKYNLIFVVYVLHLKFSLLSLSCSSDLCNYVDGAELAVISSATSKTNNSFCFGLFINGDFLFRFEF